MDEITVSISMSGHGDLARRAAVRAVTHALCAEMPGTALNVQTTKMSGADQEPMDTELDLEERVRRIRTCGGL